MIFDLNIEFYAIKCELDNLRAGLLYKNLIIGEIEILYMMILDL